MKKNWKILCLLLLSVVFLFTMCNPKTKKPGEANRPEGISSELVEQTDTSQGIPKAGFYFKYYYKIERKGWNSTAATFRINSINWTSLLFTPTINQHYIEFFDMNNTYIVPLSFTTRIGTGKPTTSNTIIDTISGGINSNNFVFDTPSGRYYRVKNNSIVILRDSIIYPVLNDIVKDTARQVVMWPPTR